MYPGIKYHCLPFAAICVSLLFCVPLLGFDSADNNKTSRQQSAVSVTSAVDATDSALEAAGLVNLRASGSNFDICLRYSTSNNFTGSPIYHSDRCYLRSDTARKLVEANQEFSSIGYKIKIFDAYRPFTVQKFMYQKISDGLRPFNFIANPYQGGSNHNRGAAVDVTLEHLDGTPVEMPTDFDTFNDSADIYNENLPAAVKRNRELLANIMKKHGFIRCEAEWWHFDDSNAASYSIIDILF